VLGNGEGQAAERFGNGDRPVVVSSGQLLNAVGDVAHGGGGGSRGLFGDQRRQGAGSADAARDLVQQLWEAVE
jgi:hypothetical protein